MNRLCPAQPQGHGIHRPAAGDVVIGRDADILSDVDAPGIAAAIWQRIPDPDFQNWIDALPAGQLPDLRTTVPVHLAEAALLSACGLAGMPDGPEQHRLASDAAALALIYSRILRCTHVRIRFDVSSGVMCPKFHLDNVPARLLCTYRGAGTEYVLENHQDDTRRIRSMRTGSAGLFRGRTWPGEERCRLLHRSPAVLAGSGPRLLLAIDTAETG
ncbi:DUF1826 domain-containing protein [Roseibium sp. RKSG952]|uniref:DUF1826 domain-containing protein n=1 Tax=Roseibium sp. RKSG952 TaxID=2529384 RepID=UPI0012BCBEB5|nr:DUF1826 domain-containing protein [Roseibium sp. RKSG952]MTH97183.1 DUF1826 domain-containing protein [Roseibium sp. RKSG952]